MPSPCHPVLTMLVPQTWSWRHLPGSAAFPELPCHGSFVEWEPEHWFGSYITDPSAAVPSIHATSQVAARHYHTVPPPGCEISPPTQPPHSTSRRLQHALPEASTYPVSSHSPQVNSHVFLPYYPTFLIP